MQAICYRICKSAIVNDMRIGPMRDTDRDGGKLAVGGPNDCFIAQAVLSVRHA